MQILFIFKYLVCSQKSKMQEQEKNVVAFQKHSLSCLLLVKQSI